MDVKLINPFIDATLHVLETMASTRAQPGKPYLKKNQAAQGDVSAVIGLTGEVKGTISVSFTEKSILAIVSSMFGEEMKELNDDIKDAAGEIANMISGQARQKLEELGRSLKAAIPTVIMGRDHSVSHITSQPIVAIPFTTDNGELTIEVCFEE
ncbi:MAG: chemotaxis protein CheX [Deltaproteobacteria bacterium]|nr:chemotaxis protein CheX [Deltaproteobacteria bacterium]MBW1860901.1 chemotaxis protein CheX [Deltaproteobacteria bacterium]